MSSRHTKVIPIGQARVARALTDETHPLCAHANLRYRSADRIVYCIDCEREVHPFDAFMILVRNHELAWKEIDRQRADLDEARTKALVSRAAKRLDREWRSRNYVPCCPHCEAALLPEDVADGRLLSKHKERERERRQFAKSKGSDGGA